MVRRIEHERARLQHVRQGAGIVLWIGVLLRDGDIIRRVDERTELPVCDRRPVDPEAVDRHPVHRSLLGIMIIRAHPEGAAGNPDHIRIGNVLLDELDKAGAGW